MWSKSSSHCIYNFNNSYLNGDEHSWETINIEVRPRAGNNAWSKHHKTFLSTERHGRRWCCSFSARFNHVTPCLFSWLSSRPSWFLSCLLAQPGPRTSLHPFVLLRHKSWDKPSRWTSRALGISLDDFQGCFHSCNVKVVQGVYLLMHGKSKKLKCGSLLRYLHNKIPKSKDKKYYYYYYHGLPSLATLKSFHPGNGSMHISKRAPPHFKCIGYA